jgi:hypothetical protein
MPTNGNFTQNQVIQTKPDPRRQSKLVQQRVKEIASSQSPIRHSNQYQNNQDSQHQVQGVLDDQSISELTALQNNIVDLK